MMTELLAFTTAIVACDCGECVWRGRGGGVADVAGNGP